MLLSNLKFVTRLGINTRSISVALRFTPKLSYSRSLSSSYYLKTRNINMCQSKSYCSAAGLKQETANGKEREFKAETKKLLDIVAKSLYSDREIFVRELVSNASDAIEKLRFYKASGKAANVNEELAINIVTDDINKKLIISDTGVGMTEEELDSCLGIIAKSGSQDFMETDANKDIIGKFGVGFYSAFMVANSVEVLTKSCLSENSRGLKWFSDGIGGSYTISEIDNVDFGTKIILNLKDDSLSFSQESTIENILKKYSKFLQVPISLNGKKINTMEPLWTKNPSEITSNDHADFYQYISANSFDTPRYNFFYKTDAPINLRCLLYIPSLKPSIFETAKEADTNVALYSRRVLIMNKTQTLVPKWLRFLKGVVDSEDIPLNLSRELLQDSSLIRRLNRIITSRTLNFLQKQSEKDAEKFTAFLNDFSLYLKEGIIMEGEQNLREEIARLLRWESSTLQAGETCNLTEYCSRMKDDQDAIYFLSSPNRKLAEASPYLAALKNAKPDAEVIYLFEPYDELVLLQMGNFSKKPLRSIETVVAELKEEDVTMVGDESKEQTITWCKEKLQSKVKDIKFTKSLNTHPCMVSVKEAGAMRHFLRTSLANASHEEKMSLAQPLLELNPNHEIVKFIMKHHKDTEQTDLSEKLLNHLLNYGLAEAGLVDDVRGFVASESDLVMSLLKNKSS